MVSVRLVDVPLVQGDRFPGCFVALAESAKRPVSNTSASRAVLDGKWPTQYERPPTAGSCGGMYRHLLNGSTGSSPP
jgi:hypothetical protein